MTDALIKAAAVLALLVILFFGEQYIEGRGYDRARAEDQAAIEKIKREATGVLARETQKARAAEKSLQDITDTQNLKDADHEKTVSVLADRLRRAAGPAGRLRDPHAARCGPSGGSAPGDASGAAGDRPADPAETGGLLSAELTELLQSVAREADAINDAYISCRADGFSVRAVMKLPE